MPPTLSAQRATVQTALGVSGVPVEGRGVCAKCPIKQFETVADGARFPGAAFFVAGGAAGGTVATSAIIASGGGVIREVFASIDADARRTSGQIASAVSELATAQRW